ncbi:hypothetical protein F3K20_12965 [Streptomyces scabiei]|uniref:hypothetical protein n=1 Tax=Streptomyces scabiei TaxID=1930 RepID=UPI0007659E5D|nr:MULTISPECIES: hypothetical protein [Streptomyces]QTU45656.1 hypothetical protein F3K20_12965 [Streptomyces sp. LBUM 1482]
MSTRWEWRDTGSGPGALQLVADDPEFTRTRAAYRAYADHGEGCRVCAQDPGQCATAADLWETYRQSTR